MRYDPIVEEIRAQGCAPRIEVVWSEELQTNKALQPTGNPLPGLSAAELSR